MFIDSVSLLLLEFRCVDYLWSRSYTRVLQIEVTATKLGYVFLILRVLRQSRVSFRYSLPTKPLLYSSF